MNILPIVGFAPFGELNFGTLPLNLDYNIGISSESRILIDKFNELTQHFHLLASRPSAYHRFYNLVIKWKYDTKFLSSTTQIIMHPAYQQIIGMGHIALPFIFSELERENDHWYWALKCITGEDPVAPEDRGNMLKMREAWLNWGRLHGYIH